MSWSAVAGATSYVFEADKDPTFPILTTHVHFAGVTATNIQFLVGDFCGGCEQGNYVAHVYAVTAAGIRGAPSATQSFSVFYNNPLPSPPTPLAPINGATVTLPFTLSWTDVPNPQDQGYEIEIAKDSLFRTIEDDEPEITGPHFSEVNLTPGTKFWRVRAEQGDNGATTAAETAWSKAATFTVSSAPPAVVGFTLTRPAPFSGENEFAGLQLSAVAPAGGIDVTLTSSNPAAVTVPASVAFGPGFAFPDAAVPIQIGQVTTATSVTLTARLGTSSRSVSLVVKPAAPASLDFGSVTTVSGGSQAGAFLLLNGAAPAAGAVVDVASSSPALVVPSTFTVEGGGSAGTIPITTKQVAVNTTATITVTWQGVSVSATITVTPQPKPVSLVFSTPSITVSEAEGSGTVTVGSASPTDAVLQVSSNDPAVLPFLSTAVIIPAGSLTGGITLLPAGVTVPTVVTVFVSGGGVTVSASITVNPEGTAPPPPTLASFTVNPSSVVGGASTTGKVTLPVPAPAGGLVVLISNDLPLDATMPTGVTVPAGSTSVSFSITTNPVDTTTLELEAINGTTLLSAPLSITVGSAPPPPPAQSATLGVTATGRTGVTVLSTPSGISDPVGTSQGAAFAVGTKVTLSATDGREVIFSGVCSSGGQKVKTCSFTITGNASETANVQ